MKKVLTELRREVLNFRGRGVLPSVYREVTNGRLRTKAIECMLGFKGVAGFSR